MVCRGIRGGTIHRCIDALWYSPWRYTNWYTCLWTTIRDAAFFLIYQNIQLPKIGLTYWKRKYQNGGNIKRRETSQSAFLNSLNLPAGTSIAVIVIFILVMKQTKLSDIVRFCLNPIFSIFDWHVIIVILLRSLYEYLDTCDWTGVLLDLFERIKVISNFNLIDKYITLHHIVKPHWNKLVNNCKIR